MASLNSQQRKRQHSGSREVNRDCVERTLTESTLILCKNVEPDNLLLVLKAKGVLKQDHVTKIEKMDTDTNKVDKLIQILIRSSVSSYEAFMDFLQTERSDLYEEVKAIEDKHYDISCKKPAISTPHALESAGNTDDAIKKCIAANNNCVVAKPNSHIKTAIRVTGKRALVKNQGASRSYRHKPKRVDAAAAKAKRAQAAQLKRTAATNKAARSAAARAKKAATKTKKAQATQRKKAAATKKAARSAATREKKAATKTKKAQATQRKKAAAAKKAARSEAARAKKATTKAKKETQSNC